MGDVVTGICNKFLEEKIDDILTFGMFEGLGHLTFGVEFMTDTLGGVSKLKFA